MRELVILITGASSGIGFGLVQRFIKHFTSSKNADKSSNDGDLMTVDQDSIERVTIVLASSNKERAQNAINQLMMNHDFDPFPLSKIKLDYLQVDLSSVERTVEACQMFKQRYRRLDYLYLNAGMLSIDKVNITQGLLFFMKHPVMFFMDVSATLEQQFGRRSSNDPSLGFIFCTNLFGHYIMYRMLVYIMDDRGRIVWTGSLTSDYALKHFRWSDIQALSSRYPYECSKIGVDLTSIGINNHLTRSRSGVRSFVGEPGVATTSILGDDIHWLLQKLVIVPFIYLASFLFTFITFTAWNGAASLFYLSGLDCRNAKCFDGETGQVINQEPWDTNIKYSSNFSHLIRKSFVTHRKMLIKPSRAIKDANELDGINDANADRMVGYLDQLFNEKVVTAGLLKTSK